MLKKFFTCFLIFSFTQAYAGPREQQARLNSVIDNLNYNLTVVWDQKDLEYMNGQMDAFENHLKELQAEGVTNKELIESTLGKIKDKRMAQEVQDLFEVVSASDMSNNEAREFIVEHVKYSYAQGANWSGGSVGLGLAIFIVALTTLILVMDQDNDDNQDDCNPYPYPYPYPYYPGACAVW